MTFTIGRASLPRDPSTVSWNGNQISIAGWISPATVGDTAHSDALRQQLLGLVDNPDEEVFPLTFSGFNSTWDGFYTVQSVNVSAEPGTGELRGWLPYQIQATRITNYSRPQFETIVSTAVRTNSHGVTVPVGMVYAYYTPTAYTWGDFDTASIAVTNLSTMTTDDGTVSWGGIAAPLATTSWRAGVQPADYYKGVPKIEVKYGANWYPVHGLQIPRNVGANWRLTNGFCRVYPSKSVSWQGFTVETYRSGNWFGSEFTLTSLLGTRVNFTGDGTNYADPVVVSNSSDVVSVSIPAPASILATDSGFARYRFTFSIRPGETFVAVSGVPVLTTKWGFGRTTNTASTAFAGGVAATANDANGLRYLLSTTNVFATDTTIGDIVSGDTIQPTFAVSADYQVGLVGLTTTTAVRDQFYAAASSQRRVVTR